ncbi:hypothetical protein [Segetibacter aerophilus]|uniref:Lipoprotein n=1 Tax=Segetibacter aerophilus TaxID=670293 RepID=A0A512B9D1_9BACT|nr:hypothetical protein [Segetibacter aerophilus]GEO08549.1 hypothetical protein SAE01_10450 [Segetibacter aerophilus]
MKAIQRFLLLTTLLTAFSCKDEKTNVKVLVNKFADLECRAMTLREQRFELANQLRFTQDTLMQRSKQADTTRLQSRLIAFNQQKEIMLKQSLLLADSIHTSLDDIMKNQLASKSEKQAFNDMLNEALVQRGCIKKS